MRTGLMVPIRGRWTHIMANGSALCGAFFSITKQGEAGQWDAEAPPRPVCPKCRKVWLELCKVMEAKP
jgi:hypothetical protein